MMLHARPFAVEHDGGSGAQDPRGLLAAAVGKPPRIDPSKPGTPHASMLDQCASSLQAPVHAGLRLNVLHTGVALPLAFNSMKEFCHAAHWSHALVL